MDQKAFLTYYTNFHGHSKLSFIKLHQFIIIENTRIAGNKFTEKQQHSLWFTPSWLQAHVPLRLRGTGYCSLLSGVLLRNQVFKSVGNL